MIFFLVDIKKVKQASTFFLILRRMSLTATPFTIPENEENILYCSVSPDNEYIACAFANGAIRILHARTFETLARGIPGKGFADSPATCVRWAPPASEQTDWQLISCSCEGGLLTWEWDAEAGTLKRYQVTVENGNETASIDISPSGKLLLSAGSDRIIRLYNADLSLVAFLNHGIDADGLTRVTHISRIFSVRFVTETLAVSAGWESPIQIWDLRTNRSDRQAMGLGGSSDCLEPLQNTCLVVVAAMKSSPPVQMIDSVSGEVLLEESERLSSQLTAADRITVCRQSKDNGYIWCLISSPPAVVVLAQPSGMIVSRTSLPSTPLNMEVRFSTAYVACQCGVILSVTFSM